MNFCLILQYSGNFVRSVLRLLRDWGAILWDKRTGKLSFPLFSDDVTHAGSQQELDNLYIGPAFPIEVLYGTLLTVIYVSKLGIYILFDFLHRCFDLDMTYSSTMPLLNILTLFTLILAYHIDKIFLLRFYRAPPVFSEVLPRLITFLLYGAAVTHCASGIWAFGNTMFYSPNLFSRLTTYQYPVGQSILNFLITSHNWNTAVSLSERLENPFNLGLLCMASAVIVITLFPLLFEAIFAVHPLWLPSELLQKFKYAVTFVKAKIGGRGSVLAQVGTIAPNTSYFEAIPYQYLQWRIDTDSLQGNIKRKYLQQLRLRQGQAEDVLGKIVGLESYNITLNMDYAIKFGVNSSHMKRTQPNDWIVHRHIVNDARRHSFGYGAVNARRASTRMSMLDISDIPYTLGRTASQVYEKEVMALLQECSPLKEGTTWRMKRMSILRPESMPGQTKQEFLDLPIPGSPPIEELEEVVEQWT